MFTYTVVAFFSCFFVHFPSKNFCFYQFYFFFFFWLSIKFLQQNISQSKTGISDKDFKCLLESEKCYAKLIFDNCPLWIISTLSWNFARFFPHFLEATNPTTSLKWFSFRSFILALNIGASRKKFLRIIR